MNFWGKTAKITAIAGMAVGGALTITGAALLGVGCEATYSQYEGNIYTGKIGIGSSTFGWSWDANENKYYEQPMDPVTTNKNQRLSYWDAVGYARDYKNSANWNAAPNAEKDLINAMISAADETIAGAVLFSIFVLVLGASIAVFFINRKRA